MLIPKKQRNHIHASPATLPNAAVKALSSQGESSTQLLASPARKAVGLKTVAATIFSHAVTWLHQEHKWSSQQKTVLVFSYKDNPF